MENREPWRTESMGKRRGSRKEQAATGPKRREQGRKVTDSHLRERVGPEIDGRGKRVVFACSWRHPALTRGLCVGKGSAMETDTG